MSREAPAFCAGCREPIRKADRTKLQLHGDRVFHRVCLAFRRGVNGEVTLAPLPSEHERFLERRVAVLEQENVEARRAAEYLRTELKRRSDALDERIRVHARSADDADRQIARLVRELQDARQRPEPRTVPAAALDIAAAIAPPPPAAAAPAPPPAAAPAPTADPEDETAIRFKLLEPY